MGLEIDEKLVAAGYSLLGDSSAIYSLISNILHSKNQRYLKAIPYLLYKHNISDKELQKLSENLLFNEIAQITNSIFEDLNISKSIPCKEIKNITLIKEEFADEFKLQYQRQRADSIIDKQKIFQERDLQFWLSQIFTDKEKYIITQLIDDKPITKTEYEYYSRKTKKKLKGILQLRDLALTLNEKNPKLGNS